MELHTHNLLERWLLSASMAAVVGGFALQAPEAAAEEPAESPEVAAVVYHSCEAGESAYPDTSFGYGQNFHQCQQESIQSPEFAAVVAQPGNYHSKSRPLAAAGNQGQFLAKVQPTAQYHDSCEAGMSAYPDTSFGYGQNFHRCQ